MNGRKFDLRVWVLVTCDMKVFFYREGYVRTACSPFTLEAGTLSESVIHLTNNAIQRYAADYGKYEEGNQLSFSQF